MLANAYRFGGTENQVEYFSTNAHILFMLTDAENVLVGLLFPRFIVERCL